MPQPTRRKASHTLTMLAAMAGALLFAFSAHAQETPTTFDNPQQVEAWLAAKNIPALGLGVIHHGQLQSVQVYGERQHGEPASVDTVFNVASVTKTVTAALVLRLASQGQWDIDAPLSQYWTDPDVKDDPRAQQLTTRHVLNHQSGFPNWRWQAKSGKLAFEAAPGTRYGYSGEGFEYLRRALEAKFHQPLEQLAGTQIFQPLGMHDTHFTWNAARDTNRIAVPHDASGKALVVTENTEANGADLLKTTVGDYGRFLVAILNADGISKYLYPQMTKPAVQTRGQKYMGLGWELYTGLPGGETALSHGGSDPGAQTLVLLLPASKDGLIIFTNSDNGTDVFADLIAAVLKDKGQAIIDIEMKK